MSPDQYLDSFVTWQGLKNRLEQLHQVILSHKFYSSKDDLINLPIAPTLIDRILEKQTDLY